MERMMNWSAPLTIFDAHIDIFIMDRMAQSIQVVTKCEPNSILKIRNKTLA